MLSGEPKQIDIISRESGLPASAGTRNSSWIRAERCRETNYRKEVLSGMNALVIVESPAKAKTINKILGKEFTVKASVGHIKDLPSKEFGVDVEKNFAPKYVVIPGKEKIIRELKKASQGGRYDIPCTRP